MRAIFISLNKFIEFFYNGWGNLDVSRRAIRRLGSQKVMRERRWDAIDVSMVGGPICTTSLPIASKIERIKISNKGVVISFS